VNIFGTTFDYSGRMEKIRKLMAEQKVDAMLVHSGQNQYYISGMYQPAPWYPIEVNMNTETPLIIFRDKKKDPVFLITYLTGNGLKEGTWIKDVRFIDKEPYGKMNVWEYTAQVLKDNGVDKGTIGIEKDVVVVNTYTKLQALLPGARLEAIDDIFQRCRTVKDATEIDIIKKSVLITEKALQAGMKKSGVGVLETDIIIAAEKKGRSLGAIREVETMCQSGIRTANHRAMASNWKKVAENDLVMIGSRSQVRPGQKVEAKLLEAKMIE
jgi:Xaa-Pro aminopeptidase